MKKVITIPNKLDKFPKISWEDLKDKYELNALKEKEGRDVSDLKQSIIELGFFMPLCLWEDGAYICDGSGRFMALEMLEYEGYQIPDLPYIPIEAKTKKEAKQKTLAITSNYGMVTPDSIGQFKLDMEDLNLSFINIDGYDMEEIDWEPPKTQEIDTDELKGKTKHQHECPNCGHKFSTK